MFARFFRQEKLKSFGYIHLRLMSSLHWTIAPEKIDYSFDLISSSLSLNSPYFLPKIHFSVSKFDDVSHKIPSAWAANQCQMVKFSLLGKAIEILKHVNEFYMCYHWKPLLFPLPSILKAKQYRLFLFISKQK